LERCDGFSLILIDEYGRGTSYLNGMALFQTLIETLTDDGLFKSMRKGKKKSLPITVLSTNYKELFNFKFIDFNLKNLSLLYIDEMQKV
jgi:DNA mismatch repair ATPase MutS